MSVSGTKLGDRNKTGEVPYHPTVVGRLSRRSCLPPTLGPRVPVDYTPRPRLTRTVSPTQSLPSSDPVLRRRSGRTRNTQKETGPATDGRMRGDEGVQGRGWGTPGSGPKGPVGEKGSRSEKTRRASGLGVKVGCVGFSGDPGDCRGGVRPATTVCLRLWRDGESGDETGRDRGTRLWELARTHPGRTPRGLSVRWG